MISIQKGLEDFNELRTTIKGVKDINTLVELIYDNPRYDITNDLRDTIGVIDINYKSICATIQQKENSLVVLGDVEIWDNLDMVEVNIYEYKNYIMRFTDENVMKIYRVSPYDNQDYYYSSYNKIFRNGKYVETMKFEDTNIISEIDQIILRLMELNRPLKPIICHN